MLNATKILQRMCRNRRSLASLWRRAGNALTGLGRNEAEKFYFLLRFRRRFRYPADRRHARLPTSAPAIEVWEIEISLSPTSRNAKNRRKTKLSFNQDLVVDLRPTIVLSHSSMFSLAFVWHTLLLHQIILCVKGR